MSHPLLGEPVSFSGFWKAPARDHFLGLFGGIIWGFGSCFNFIAAGFVGVAISYAIGQSSPMIAALWGVLVWKEFRGADGKAWGYLALMFLAYLGAVIMIALAYERLTKDGGMRIRNGWVWPSSCWRMAGATQAQAKRMIIFDQDAAGPGGTDMMSLLVLLQAPDVDVLGVTVVTGDAWRDEEVQHSLRLLELVGRTDIPVMAGASFPLVRTKEWTLLWEKMYGTVTYLGAFSTRPNSHGPFEVPPLREGNPTTKASAEDAAHFLVRTVRAHPHEVTIYAGGPMTNLAMALTLDPQFAELVERISADGQQSQPAQRQSRICHQSAPRIQSMVRSRGFAHRIASALAEHSSHHGRRFH